jgi:hypothetical protein
MRTRRIQETPWIEQVLKNYKVVDGNCWEFQGRRLHEKGTLTYGLTRYGRAHRASFEFYKGVIPEGMLVCHTCDNPPCINPKHLFLGTNKTNRQDAKRKGRLKDVYVKTEDWKNKIAKALKGNKNGVGHYFSEKAKKNLSKRMKLNKYALGLKRSKSTKERMSISRREMIKINKPDFNSIVKKGWITRRANADAKNR